MRCACAAVAYQLCAGLAGCACTWCAWCTSILIVRGLALSRISDRPTKVDDGERHCTLSSQLAAAGPRRLPLAAGSLRAANFINPTSRGHVGAWGAHWNAYPSTCSASCCCTELERGSSWICCNISSQSLRSRIFTGIAALGTSLQRHAKRAAGREGWANREQHGRNCRNRGKGDATHDAGGRPQAKGWWQPGT